MSSSKTATLNLHRWSLSDPFLMSEMNENNSALDAAIGGLEARKTERVKLKEITTTAKANSVEIDVTDIDWAQYALVVVQTRLTGTGSATLRLAPCNSQSGVTVNGIDNYGISNGHCYVGLSGRDNLCFFFPLHRDVQQPASYTLGLDSCVIYAGKCSDGSYKTTTKIVLANTATDRYIEAGSYISIWGVK